MNHDATAGTGRSGQFFVVIAVVALVAVVAYFALGMPGMGHESGGMAGMDRRTMAAPRAMTPAEFATRVAETDSLVINVHVPAGASIAGTDLTVPYDRLAGDSRLPVDKATPILLYCQTGRMSGASAEALVGAGFTSVTELRGGLDAWQRAGLPLEAG